MKRGIIVKGIGGFYYIIHNEDIYECKPRGIFRKQKIKPLVGDVVLFDSNEDTKEGTIEKILDRKVELFRPPVANVDQAIIVFAIKNPNPDLKLLDKLLIMGEYYNLELKICINKIDIDDVEECKKIHEIYKHTGYNIIFTSTKSDIGISEINETLKDKITVFAGPSGVGKSSILNSIQRGLKLKTGDISEKIKRGKHTTRHTELLKLDGGGWVVDTPGFTSFDIDFLESNNIEKLFPEFGNYIESCKFNNCIHINEPGCAIKDALNNGYINKNRYNNYVDFVKQIAESEKRRY